ncbi:MAG: hypothetical protein EPN82_17170 [Bacteroidetes bacterium]|nr:MAG: hypothetical protein EPN82_17170 [Bacteroidota bacterium]
MFVVKYSGAFGFIKPWTAVRDNETFSQQFLTPSIIEGIEKKLFPDLLDFVGIKKIIQHRLTYSWLSAQQEQTQPRGVNSVLHKKEKQIEFSRPKSILLRSVLINPILYLAFNNRIDAEEASIQHICLCRNEDILMPAPVNNDYNEFITEVSGDEFDDPLGKYKGFELRFDKNEKAFIVGYNRFHNNEPMYGWLNIVGENPLQTYEI